MIRELCKEDLTPSFFRLLSQLGGDTKRYNIDDLWSKYLSGIAFTFVFTEKDKIMGTASVLMEEKMLKGGSSVAHIEDVVVSRSSRSLGVGKALIEWCIKAAKDFGCYKVILDCSEENISFYLKCGFISHGYCMRLNTKGE